MKVSEFKTGMKIHAAPDSETPNVVFKITRIGFEANGFESAEITYPDGSSEIAALACLQEAIDDCNCRIIK